MFNGIQRMIPHHSRTSKSHYFTHFLPKNRFIAMYRTFPTSALLFPKLTMFQSLMGIFKQCRTISAKCLIAFFQPTIKSNHLLNRFLFLFDSCHQIYAFRIRTSLSPSSILQLSMYLHTEFHIRRNEDARYW